MPKFIAFLRAINVGGHNVKMEDLRKLFEELGFSNVETFIASGNVIFDTPDGDANELERRIERHLRTALGYEVATFLRSTSELADIAKYEPFPAAELAAVGTSLYIAFLQDAPGDKAQEGLMAFRTDQDDFHVHAREIYWLRHGNMSDSKFSGALLEKTIKLPATLRNSTTVRKLVAKYPASE